MSQEDQEQAINPKPRTRIEDLPADAQELSEEEASQAAGGLVVVTPQNVTLLPNPLISKAPTKFEAYTTGGTHLDKDEVQDRA